MELLPRLLPGQLEDFIRRDLEEFWLSATSRPRLWLRDIWVDLGLLVLGRASVTLRDGRLITKGEALAELRELGAPADVVRDIHDLRYARPAPISRVQRIRRAVRARCVPEARHQAHPCHPPFRHRSFLNESLPAA